MATPIIPQSSGCRLLRARKRQSLSWQFHVAIPTSLHLLVRPSLPLWLLLLALLVWSCSEPSSVKIGFVGGLTGRVADLGIAGRDGAQLAVEEANAAGGVNGRKIDLIVRDDGQDPTKAVLVDTELIEAGVSAIIGHMTSAMSIAGATVANERRCLMLSPTTSTNELSGHDDFFFRVYPSSAEAAKRLASHAYSVLRYRRISVVYDLGNKAHTESWYQHFRKSFESLGGSIATVQTYASGPKVDFLSLAVKLTETPTDCLFVLANAMDTAMLCQQFSKIDRPLPVITSEWSATEELLKFGGKAVEGLTFFHTFDKESQSSAFVRFKEAFKSRFGYPAGFASAHAYDAINILITALRKNADPVQLGTTILQIARFEGVQGTIAFDRFGDVQRPYILMTIAGGAFKALEQ